MNRGRAARRAVAAVITLLAVVFPALTAGAGLDQPVRGTERAWAELAADDPDGARGGPASLFVRALLDTDALAARDAAVRDRAIVRARFAAILGVLACSGLLYLAVMLSRGRGIAVLSCVVFGLLPPVWHEGVILRPEVPCAVFGALSLLVLVGLPERLRASRREPAVLRHGSVIALAAAVGTAVALAVATMPVYGVFLLVPAACMLIAVVQQCVLFVRVLRRFRLRVLPFSGFFARSYPWLLPALFGLIASALLIAVARGPADATLAERGLLPRSFLATGLVVGCALVGGAVRFLQVGLAIGRRPRLSADAVLALFVVAVLLHRLRMTAADDALPAALGLAVLVAEGAGVAMLFVGARMGGLRAARTG